MAGELTFEALAELIPAAERLTHIEAARWLYEQALRIGPGGLCIEVGVWCGWTACVLAAGGPTVLAIDTFMASDQWVRLDHALQRLPSVREGTLDRFARNVGAAGLAERLVTVQARSTEAAQAVGEQTADLIFLDADHSMAAIAADLAAWHGNVKPGGTLCGDNWGIGDVQTAARAVLGALGWPAPEEAVHQLWWARRPA